MHCVDTHTHTQHKSGKKILLLHTLYPSWAIHPRNYNNKTDKKETFFLLFDTTKQSAIPSSWTWRHIYLNSRLELKWLEGLKKIYWRIFFKNYLGGLTALNWVAESRRPSLVRKAVRALGPSKSRKSSSIPLPPCQTSPTCAKEETTLSILLRQPLVMKKSIFFFLFFWPEVHRVQCPKGSSWIVHYLPGGSRWADCRQSRPPATTWLAGGRKLREADQKKHAHTQHKWIDSHEHNFSARFLICGGIRMKTNFPGSSSPQKENFGWNTHTHTHTGWTMVCSSCWMGKTRKKQLVSAVRRPIRRMKLIFSGVCTHAHTQGRKHTHIRRMHIQMAIRNGSRDYTTHACTPKCPDETCRYSKASQIWFYPTGT